MTTERYLIRFIKSLIYFTCWIFLILILMILLHQTEMTFTDLFVTKNGFYLWGFALIFSAVYPFIGYCNRRLNASAAENIEALDSIAAKSSLKRVNSNLNEIEYNASNLYKKIILMFEDRIIITTDEKGDSYISGPRKEVVKIIFRYDTYLISKND